MRYVYKQLFYNLGTLFNLYLKYNSLYIRLQLEEIRFYSFLLSGIEEKTLISKKYEKFCILREKFLILKFVVLRKKIVKYYGLFLRKVLKKYKLRSFYKYVKKLKRSVPKGHILTYFLINRRYKKARRLKTPRLKFVH